jgi:hypothetical protein
MDDHWWSQAGGSSFVEIVTGINIALCGWEHFQNSIRAWGRQVDMLVGKAIEDESDAVKESTKADISSLLAYNKSLWVWVKRAAFVSAVAGMVMLYLNRFCGWDFLLLLPLVCYWVVSTILLWIAKWKLDGFVAAGKKIPDRTRKQNCRSGSSKKKTHSPQDKEPHWSSATGGMTGIGSIRIRPVAAGGGDELENLQPLQWENNRHKSDLWPQWACKRRAA